MSNSTSSSSSSSTCSTASIGEQEKMLIEGNVVRSTLSVPVPWARAGYPLGFEQLDVTTGAYTLHSNKLS